MPFQRKLLKFRGIWVTGGEFSSLINFPSNALSKRAEAEKKVPRSFD